MPEAAALLGNIQSALAAERFEEAVRLAEEYLRPVSRDVLPKTLHLALAEACERIDDYAQAQHLYHLFAQHWPNDRRTAEAHMAAARIAVDHLNDYDGALRLIMVLLKNWSGWDGLADARELLERVQQTLARTSVVPEGGGTPAGPCMVIRQTSDQLPIARIGKIVASYTGGVMADETRRLRRSPGLLALDLDGARALRLAERLQDDGVPALVIPADQARMLPPVAEVRACAVSEQALSLTTGTGVKNVPWEDVRQVVAGFVEREEVTQQGASSEFGNMLLGLYAGPGVVGLHPAVQMRKQPVRRRKRVRFELIDVFTASGEARYRLTTQTASVRTKPTGRKDFASLVRSVLVGARGRLRANEAAYIIAGRQRIQNLREFVFEDLACFDLYEFWQLNLHTFS